MPCTLDRPAPIVLDDLDPGTRRHFLAGGLGLGAAVLLGCGDDDPERADDGPDGPGFPVTVPHKYGSTRIPSRPTRVVSVGDTDQDPILALGVTPVGVRDWFGEQPSALWPWARDAVKGPRPTVLAAAPELDVERIAALAPDLIVGTYSAMTRAQYRLLSRIAPTVAQSADHPDFGQPWQEITTTIGRSLGRESRARRLVADVEAQLRAARRAHPEFEGRTAVVGSVTGRKVSAFTSTDNASRFLSALGFRSDPRIDELARRAGVTGLVDISLERLDLFDRDVALWYESPEEARDLVGSRVYDRLAVHREGRDLFLGYVPLGGALSFSTVLSLPYAVKQLVPRIAAAVDGDPATEAPAAGR